MSISKYVEAIGRRKSAVARVRLYHGGSGVIKVNDRLLEDYVPLQTLSEAVMTPLRQTGMEQTFDISVHVQGGGVHGQIDGIRLGIARALVLWNPELRASLKKSGFLRRDARVRERKKFGRKSARRSKQWSKR